ncbi:MAG: hypothetical protein R3F51_17720 [Cyanobacteriota/Melainabacteria group bacterium]
MNKLRTIRVKAFRGALADLTLDFTKNNQSVAIFGENATGKSTVTDAVEWFFTSQVGHLWAEDCRVDALRNVLVQDDSEDSEVEMKFSDSKMDSVKVLPVTGKHKQNNSTKAFSAFIDQAAKERILLRHADVAAFVTATKSEKRQEIEKIVGYDDVRKFRDAIRGTKTKLEKDPDYLAATRLVEAAESDLLKLSGETIAKKEQVFAKMNSILADHKIDVIVSDSNSYKTAMQLLKGQIGDPKKTEKRLGYESLKKHLEVLDKSLVSYFAVRDLFTENYRNFISDSGLIAKVKLEAFLKAGITVLSEVPAKSEQCPFCLTDYDLESLRQTVEQRVEEIEELSSKYKTLSEDKAKLTIQLSEIKNALTAISTSPNEFFEGDIRQLLQTLISSIPNLVEHFEERFASLESIEFEDDLNEETSTSFLKFAKVVNDKIESLTLSDSENKALVSYQTIDGIAKAFSQRKKNKELVDVFRIQIATLGDIYENFLTVQNEAVQKVLDTISEDVNHFYNLLLPSATIDNISLKLLGEQGIEFEYSFHGNPTHPPKKYLSESYLNCLGIVLFLSSAKLFNKQCRFFVLDDIVTSFDTNLRRMLIRLLKQEFSDWQIVLLTHEKFWFDIMKRELEGSNWLFKNVSYSPSSGTTLEQSLLNKRDILQAKFDDDTLTGTDLRIYLENVLKEICVRLKVPVEYRPNDRNEDRMSGELLSSLKGALKKHKCSEVNESETLKNLDGSALVVNKDSHDSSVSIDKSDLRVSLDDIDKLVQTFKCDDCKSWVQADNRGAAGSIYCGCGKKSISWV